MTRHCVRSGWLPSQRERERPGRDRGARPSSSRRGPDHEFVPLLRNSECNCRDMCFRARPSPSRRSRRSSRRSCARTCPSSCPSASSPSGCSRCARASADPEAWARALSSPPRFSIHSLRFVNSSQSSRVRTLLCLDASCRFDPSLRFWTRRVVDQLVTRLPGVAVGSTSVPRRAATPLAAPAIQRVGGVSQGKPVRVFARTRVVCFRSVRAGGSRVSSVHNRSRRHVS